uniref:Uncharacterized protein n=1 Tax=Tanacetum cinerariifolium TaxID=118510 RepID=A0A6L2JDB5_TANCI|nr:hypothetical protein [Tanacetum cinerariifolium]
MICHVSSENPKCVTKWSVWQRVDNIIPEPYIAFELGKSINLTEAIEEEVARQIVTESVLEPARRRPLEQFVFDTMKALKESKKTSKRQPGTGGSREGTGVTPGVLDVSTFVPATSSKGTGNKPRVLDEENITSEANVILDWGSEQESENFKEEDDEDDNDDDDDDDDDDDKSINLEETDDKETKDEFMHSKENVQDDDEESDVEETNDELVHADEQVNDDEDEEMTNAEYVDTRNSDEENTNAIKADAEKTEVVNDEIKKAKLPPTSSSLSSLQVNIINEVKNQLPKFLPKTVFDFATLVIQSMIKNALKKTPLPVAQSSSQAQYSLKAAESLSEYELKTIIFDKMEKSRDVVIPI